MSVPLNSAYFANSDTSHSQKGKREKKKKDNVHIEMQGIETNKFGFRGTECQRFRGTEISFKYKNVNL